MASRARALRRRPTRVGVFPGPTVCARLIPAPCLVSARGACRTCPSAVARVAGVADAVRGGITPSRRVRVCMARRARALRRRGTCC